MEKKPRKLYRETFRYEGKRIDVTARTKRELAEKIAARKTALNLGEHKLDHDITVRVWAEEWRVVYKASIVGSETMGNVQSIINRINNSIGDMKMVDVKPIYLQTIFNDADGLSQSYLNKLKFYTNQLFQSAQDNNIILSNPAYKLNIPKGTKGTHRILTPHERSVLIEVCKNNKYGIYALIMLYMGLRPGEVARIQGRHIDFENAILHVDGTKTDSARRDVPIPAPLLTILKENRVEPFNYLLTDKNGNQLSKTSRRRYWEYIIKACNIAMGAKTDYGQKQRLIGIRPFAEDISAYSLRHTAISDWAAAGVPITTAQRWAGHSTIEMTANIYTTVTAHALEDGRDKINALLEKIG